MADVENTAVLALSGDMRTLSSLFLILLTSHTLAAEPSWSIGCRGWRIKRGFGG